MRRHSASGLFAAVGALAATSGARFSREVTPKVAVDRAEIRSASETAETPAGKFRGGLKTAESFALEPGTTGTKLYAPNVGFIQDDTMKLTRGGPAAEKGRE